jgi:hypothetical protein
MKPGGVEIACTASGGSLTVREGVETESTPSLTVAPTATDRQSRIPN